MTKLKTSALALTVLAIPAIAFANLNVGDTVGVDDAAITAMLTAQGYTVLEVEVEDDEIEVEVEKDGVMSELTVDPTSGAILSVELEDDESADDDEDDEAGDTTQG